MNDTAKWLIGLFCTVVVTAAITDRLATKRERRKRAEDDTRVARNLLRKLGTDMHLAVIALAEARRELDPEPRGGDCKPQLTRLKTALGPLVESLDQLDSLKDLSLVRDFTNWLHRTRVLLDEAINTDLGNPAGGAGINEAFFYNEAPPIRLDIRRRMIEVETLGNQILERIRRESA